MTAVGQATAAPVAEACSDLEHACKDSSELGHHALSGSVDAGRVAAGRQKQPQDFSTFLKNADSQEPRRQATSFSSFIRQGLLMQPRYVCKPLLTVRLSSLPAEAWPLWATTVACQRSSVLRNAASMWDGTIRQVCMLVAGEQKQEASTHAAKGLQPRR